MFHHRPNAPELSRGNTCTRAHNGTYACLARRTGCRIWAAQTLRAVTVPERIVSAAGLQLVLADSFDGWQPPCVVENCLARAVGPEYWPERTSWRTFDPPPQRIPRCMSLLESMSVRAGSPRVTDFKLHRSRRVPVRVDGPCSGSTNRSGKRRSRRLRESPSVDGSVLRQSFG